MFTKQFTELSRRDAASAGGKGASLGELTRAGIPVPPGFVVLASAFERFLEETDLNVEIDAILHTVNHKEMHTIESASEKIQALILDAPMPKDIATEIMRSYDALKKEASPPARGGEREGVGGLGKRKGVGEFFVAVRSSATAEDSSEAAWAGQLDSFLNTTEKDLLKNVQRCWASLFTPRAIFYRFELHTRPSSSTPHAGGGVASPRAEGVGAHKKLEKVSVAVVVQKMVESEVSGIAFSVHPVTEDRNQMIIEAGFGLGEAIVSGQITPDSYVVEKQPRRIIDKNISEQERQLIRSSSIPPYQRGAARLRAGDVSSLTKGALPSSAGGMSTTTASEDLGTPFGKRDLRERNKWVGIPKEKAAKQKLSDQHILELSDLILKIENYFGFPCDIEWAFAGGKFYILQSRPITTLSK